MLSKLKWKFVRFMYGRYGVDELYTAGLVLFLILQFIQIFTRQPILNVATLIIIILMFYRVFSKDILARQKENKKFLMIKRKAQSKWKMFIRRVKDIQSHRYRKCSSCNTTLRLPRKTGPHKTRCPNCGHAFEVKIWL